MLPLQLPLARSGAPLGVADESGGRLLSILDLSMMPLFPAAPPPSYSLDRGDLHLSP